MPAALDGRFGGDLDRLLDGRLVADRRVELDDDRRRDADDLTVGELEPAADLRAGVDGGEAACDGLRVAVTADHRATPRVLDAVAERFGDVEGGAIAVERTRDGLAVGIRQRDPLEPAVTDLDPDGRGRHHVSGGVGGLEFQRRRGRRNRLAG